MASVVDYEPTLTELLDLDSFKEVARSFCDLYGLGIKVFDVEGKKAADITGSEANLTGYLFRFHETQVQITRSVAALRSIALPGSGRTVDHDDFLGLRYKLVDIEFNGGFLGRIIFGPYRPRNHTFPAAALASVSGLDLHEVQGLLSQVPQATEETVNKVLAHYRNTVDVILQASFKALMTNRVHLASTTEAFDSLEKTNRELVRANEQLRELDQLKSNFIATVSHELRTPLTSVIGYSEMLIEGMAGELSQEQVDYVRTILEKGESLLTLIGQVLDLSRIESGNVMMNRESSDVRELAELSISDVLPQATKRRLNITVQVGEGVRPIQVDRDKIRRVLTNLLGNAVKFTNEGGSIQVHASLSEFPSEGEDRFDMFEPERTQCLVIEVRDSGIGIPDDKLERIFDTFYQVDNSSTRQFGGTGLGLSIARNFVVAHGGTMTVRSELGRGSTFSIALPYKVDEGESTVEMEGVRFDER